MHVLYVGYDRRNPQEFCPGSLLCMTLLEKLSTDDVRVQDTRILRQTEALPDWLNGTPILVSADDNVPYRGTDAVRVLQRMIESAPTVASPEHVVAPASKARGAPPRMVPQPTRQPSAAPRTNHVESRPPQSATLTADAIQDGGPDLDALPPDTMENGKVENAAIRDDKVTDEDLQRYMEQRKNSAASANPNTMQA